MERPGLEERVCQRCVFLLLTRERKPTYDRSALSLISLHLGCLGSGGVRVAPCPLLCFNNTILALLLGQWNSFSNMNCKSWIINSLPKVFHWLTPVLPSVNWFWFFLFRRNFCHHWDQSIFTLMHGSLSQHILSCPFNLWRRLFVKILYFPLTVLLFCTSESCRVILMHIPKDRLSNIWIKIFKLTYGGGLLSSLPFPPSNCPALLSYKIYTRHVQLSHCLFGVNQNKFKCFHLSSTH